MTDKGEGSYLNRRNSPHFSTIVSGPLGHGIRIPTGFMMKYGDSLGKVVILKVPNGAPWHVELLTVNGETWLQKGWQEFGEFYAIKEFHFLLFRYDGNSHFHVVIFDKTAIEIDYPVRFFPGWHGKGSKKRHKSEDYHDDEDGGSVEILDFDNWKKREKSKDVDKDKRPLKQTKIQDESLEGTSRGPPPKPPSIIGTNRSKKDNLERALSFKSENPFFICKMQTTYVSTSFTLNIPLTFAKKHFCRDSKEGYELRVPESTNKWKVCVVFYERNAKIHRGWREFAKENKLAYGDVCVFELIKGTKIFNVIVFQEN